ncbi:hypothetical protein OOU_Y34scaffold00528g50 [Pyricularia oryzae Y34]|uniref:Uncharacterized protein n=2 Tax=Pyricularia oryzae TaxID=318829 RepID=A0AA97NYK2_PYRO3|nr:hypothetical protein OOU_Y34scaffold00528g50 [Pyricularia oryzae Y34]
MSKSQRLVAQGYLRKEQVAKVDK